MAKTDSTALLEGLDIDGIIRQSLTDDLSPTVEAYADDLLDEAYVAEPKTYSQVSEFVSQKTKEAHVKLYQGFIDTLNKVSAELDTASRSDNNNKYGEFRSLKDAESKCLNGVWLHELYFSNCYDPHSEIYMDSIAFLRLERDFGTFDDWQTDFVACAMSVDDGWAVCGYNMFLKRYVNTVIKGYDDDVMVGLYPLIVVDMHEHSYFRDYATDAQSYLIAQMREFNWNVINDRFKKAEAIHEVLK